MTGAARLGAPGRFLQLRHGQTHYKLDDDQQKPLLVCIHGWSTASYVWDPLKPSLQDKGYRVLTYDLYGRGFSDRPGVPNTADLFTGQLTELLEKLSLNNDDVTIAAYSMGGAIAARYVSARLDKVKRLLLIAPAGMEVRATWLRTRIRNNPRFLDPHVLALLQPVLRHQFRSSTNGFKNDPNVMSVFWRQMRELEYRGYIPALLSSLNGVLAARMETEHRDIARSNLPVRAIFAEDDSTIPTEKAKGLFDNWYRQREDVSFIIEGAGHAVTYTHPEQIMSKAGEFI